MVCLRVPCFQGSGLSPSVEVESADTATDHHELYVLFTNCIYIHIYISISTRTRQELPEYLLQVLLVTTACCLFALTR